VIYMVQREKCIMCGACLTYCKEGAIIFREKKADILAEKCTGCGNCVGRCRTRAIRPVREKP